MVKKAIFILCIITLLVSCGHSKNTIFKFFNENQEMLNGAVKEIDKIDNFIDSIKKEGNSKEVLGKGIRDNEKFSTSIKNEIIEKVINTAEISEIQIDRRNKFEIKFVEETTNINYIDFYCGTKTDSKGKTYIQGIYYSQDEEPKIMNGFKEQLEATDSGWVWSYENWDYYTEKINENWFYYKMYG